MTRFQGRTALVTGASRGIGAAVAILLAEQGADVAVNFRSKGSRAQEIAAQIHALGRRPLLAQADLTDESSLNAMAVAIKKTFGQLHVLVLNASGGLEKGKPANYAMELNLTAQVRTLEAVLPLMPEGGCVIFVTSHLAHFYGRKPVYAAYEGIAASKKAGEDALRSKMPARSGGGAADGAGIRCRNRRCSRRLGPAERARHFYRGDRLSSTNLTNIPVTLPAPIARGSYAAR